MSGFANIQFHSIRRALAVPTLVDAKPTHLLTNGSLMSSVASKSSEGDIPFLSMFVSFLPSFFLSFFPPLYFERLEGFERTVKTEIPYRALDDLTDVRTYVGSKSTP